MAMESIYWLVVVGGIGEQPVGGGGAMTVAGAVGARWPVVCSRQGGVLAAKANPMRLLARVTRSRHANARSQPRSTGFCAIAGALFCSCVRIQDVRAFARGGGALPTPRTTPSHSQTNLPLPFNSTAQWHG